MRVLGIETATSIASVGIVDADHVAAEQTLPMRGNHARTLLPLIDEVLAAAGMGVRDLGLLAVSIGPGSFTGLRIGLSVAKGLALATGLPVSGVPTLEAYARRAGPRPGLLCPVLDARKGEVYAAAFRWSGDEPVCVAAPVAVTPERFAASLRPPCTLVGDGVDAYFELWRRALGEGNAPPAEKRLVNGGDGRSDLSTDVDVLADVPVAGIAHESRHGNVLAEFGNRRRAVLVGDLVHHRDGWLRAQPFQWRSDFHV